MLMLSRTKALLTIALVGFFSVPAHAIDTKAKAAYVLDQTTGTVLLAKNVDAPLPPASMSKLMTIYVALEFIANGNLKLDERLPVSQHAKNYGGSTMFLDTKDRVSVKDLLQGIIVLSGNDASAVIAEALSPDGTEAGFAQLMTMRAQQMGMTNSVFKNSNGWPTPGHVMSMRDLGLLANRLITDYPEYYSMFSQQEFLFDGRAPANTRNRNPLLGLGIGADGLKTGHTEQAGYGLVGSAKQGDRRIIFVISGLESSKERAEEAETIVNWAFRQFAAKSFGTAGQAIVTAPIWDGSESSVELALDQDLTVSVPISSDQEINFEAVYDSPLQAPIIAGNQYGTLFVKPAGLPEFQVPLVAKTDVEKGGFMSKITVAAKTVLAKIDQRTAGAN